MVKGQLHVDSDIRVRILVDTQTSRRMLQKAVQCPDLDFPYLGQGLEDFFRDEMASASHRRKLDLCLVELHSETANGSRGIFNAS